jgi:hypothetical protein
MFMRSGEALGVSQGADSSSGSEREKERGREGAVLAEIQAPLNRVVSGRASDVD